MDHAVWDSEDERFWKKKHKKHKINFSCRFYWFQYGFIEFSFVKIQCRKYRVMAAFLKACLKLSTFSSVFTVRVTSTVLLIITMSRWTKCSIQHETVLRVGTAWCQWMLEWHRNSHRTAKINSLFCTGHWIHAKRKTNAKSQRVEWYLSDIYRCSWVRLSNSRS